jgi:UDP-glucuronate decarboxylase
LQACTSLGLWWSAGTSATWNIGTCQSLGIRSCYDEGKRCAETLFMDHNQNNVAIKIIRIFNTYGPNMNPVDGRVNFVVQALQGQDITILEMDCKLVRSICRRFGRRYGSNELILSFRFRWIWEPNEFTMLELAKAVIDLTGSKSEISLQTSTSGWS